MIIIEVQHVAEVKIVTTYVNVVDVNVTTRSKAIKKHVFKDKKLRNTKNATD
jgi:hypothetical protein